jgi:hypothetical protein
VENYLNCEFIISIVNIPYKTTRTLSKLLDIYQHEIVHPQSGLFHNC